MKKERVKHITRLHIILFFLVIIIGLIIYIVVKIKLNNSDVKYKKFEKEIVTASEIYYSINDIELENGYEKRININKLNKTGLLQNDLLKKCKGYVVISSEKDIYTDEYEIIHRPYIKCGNKYTTINYSEY